jgi:tRNA1Val (adenine37-N6)-methyltransferase
LQENAPNNNEETCEELGLFKIIQKKRGHRFTIDSVCLSDFVLPVKSTDKVIDIGTGSCVIPMLLLQKSRVRKIVGVEVQDSLIEIAKKNVEINNISDKVSLLRMDYKNLKTVFGKGSFDLVVCNPPYVRRGCGRMSDKKERAIARMELIGSLKELVDISSYLINENGRICYIYPVARFKEVLSVLEMNGLNVGRLRFIHSKRSKSSELFMVEASFKEKNFIVGEPLFLSQK